MIVVSLWVKTEKKPIPQEVIFRELSGTLQFPIQTVKSACRALERKGFIRKTMAHNAGYIQLRSI